MVPNLRKTGISIVDDMLWGTHFCCFYETPQDLLALLGPYFATGLELGEFCVWVISDPLTEEDAMRALRHEVPDLDRYLAERSIEIIPLNEWYLKGGAFDLHRVIASWNEKLDHALARGYTGMRVSGNTAWIQKKDWRDFREYEKELDVSIANQRMIVLCTYPLTASRAAEILDVARLHQVAVARRSGNWEIVETPELRQAKQEIKRLNEELEQRVIERTSELAATNEALRREIVQRQQAEDRLRLVIDTIPTMVFTALPDGSVEFANQRWLQYLGLSLEDVQGWGWEATIHPEDRASSIDHWRSTMAAGQSAENELRVRRADGVYRWILGRFVPLRDEIGNIVKWYGVSTDIEDRKRAEDELRQQKEILQKIFDYIPVMIAFVGEDGRVELVNRAWERSLGWTLHELEEQHLDIYALAYPDPQYRQQVLDVVAAATGEWTDLKVRVRDGRVIDMTVAIVHLSDGTSLVIAQDITERKQAEEALRRSESNFRTLADKSLQGIAIFQDQKIVYANPAQSAVLGYTVEELKSMSVEQIIALTHPIDRPVAVERVRKRIAGEELSQFIELRILRKDGSSRWIQSFNNLIEYDGQPAILTASIDITERKQAEATIRSLLQISEKLHATLDIDALLDSLVIEAMKLIDAEIGWSGLRTEEGMVCHTHIARDLQVVPFKYFWPPGVGLPGWVLVHKVPYVMNDAQSDKMIIPEIRERFGVNAAIDTPILDAQGEVIGFFEVNNKKNGAGFSESDVEKLVAASRIASIALQNAMSYGNLERAEKALRESQLHLQRLSRQLLQAQETERRAIARELHDEIGQRLTGLGLLLSSQHPSPDQLTDAQALVRDLIARLRNLSLDLRPTILDDLGLLPALVWLFQRYTAQTNVSVRLEHRLVEEQRFDPDVETTAYRIVQEALTNVARHAGVNEVTVRLWTDDATLWVVVADQGRGFDSQKIDSRASSGLTGMLERAALLGSSLTIEAASGGGTRLTATLPLHSGAGPREQEQGP